MTAYKKEASLKNETSFLYYRKLRKTDLAAFLYAVRSRQRILKNSDLGCSEGEQDKEQSNHAKHGNCGFGRLPGSLLTMQLNCFINIYDCGGNEENGNVDPIG